MGGLIGPPSLIAGRQAWTTVNDASATQGRRANSPTLKTYARPQAAETDGGLQFRLTRSARAPYNRNPDEAEKSSR